MLDADLIARYRKQIDDPQTNDSTKDILRSLLDLDAEVDRLEQVNRSLEERILVLEGARSQDSQPYRY